MIVNYYIVGRSTSILNGNGNYIRLTPNQSLANILLTIDSYAIDMVEKLEGTGRQYDVFLDNHPRSTQGTPKYYIIRNNKFDNITYKIYEHKKNVGWLCSSHEYKKIYSLKIIKEIQPFVNTKRYLKKRGATFEIMQKHLTSKDNKIITPKIENRKCGKIEAIINN